MEWAPISLDGMVGVLIHVDLDHLRLARVLAGQRVDNGRDEAAASAPRRPEIDQHQPIGLQHGLLEFLIVHCQWRRHGK